MSWMRALRYVAVGLGLAYAVPLACGSGGVVGGECKEGSPPDCLGTGANTGGGNTGGNAATGGDLNVSGNRPGDAGNGTGATSVGGDGELTDGGIFDSPLDGVADAGPPLECMPPHDSPSHCGDCDTQCVEPTPL